VIRKVAVICLVTFSYLCIFEFGVDYDLCLSVVI